MNTKKQVKIVAFLVLSAISITIQCVQPYTHVYGPQNERKLEEENTSNIHNQEFQRRLQGGYTAAVKEYIEMNNITFQFHFENERIMLFNPEILAGQIWVAHVNKLGRSIAKIIVKGGFGRQEGTIVAFETYNTSNE